jgi:KDO2-lipid IV(A) lauroyltransferase
MHDIVSWTYLYPVRGLSRLLPVRSLQWLAEKLAGPYATLHKRRRQQVRERMSDVFRDSKPPAPPAVMADEFSRKDMRKGIDDLLIRRLGLEKMGDAATVTGLEHLDNALEDGKGVIVISAHFHANRLSKYSLRRIGYPFMSIRNRLPRSSTTSRFGEHFLVPVYGEFLDDVVEDEVHTQDASLGPRLLRRLRENGIVNIHIDAAMSSEWFWVPFLNEERPFAGGFIRIAELTGAPLVPMCCLGNSSAFEVNFDAPVRYTDKSTPEAFTGRLMSNVHRLESWVLAHPTEWELWTRTMKRREKTTP